MKFIFLFMAMVITQSALAKTPGYQGNFGVGADYTGDGASRGTSYLLHMQLGTYSKFLRFHGAFNFLYGGAYQSGEGALGISIYPISKFTSEKASIHPFLIGQGVLSLNKNGGSIGKYAGYSYGAGVDWLLRRRFGIAISVQQYKTDIKSVRFVLDLFWFRPEEI